MVLGRRLSSPSLCFAVCVVVIFVLIMFDSVAYNTEVIHLNINQRCMLGRFIKEGFFCGNLILVLFHLWL